MQNTQSFVGIQSVRLTFSSHTIKLTVIEMLYQAPKSPAARLFSWVRKTIPVRRAHPVSDIRELSPHLRSDIGATDGSYPFCRGS
jgi:hypothetical protein